MKLEKISVRGFRVIREADITDIPMIAGFWGRNGSGKSALLHAIVATRNMAQFRNWPAFNTRGLEWPDPKLIYWRGGNEVARVVLTFDQHRAMSFAAQGNSITEAQSLADASSIRYFPPRRALASRQEQLSTYSESDLAIQPRMIHSYMHWFLNRKIRERLESNQPNEFDRVNYWMARFGFGPVRDVGSADQGKAAFLDETTGYETHFIDGGFGGNVFAPIVLECFGCHDCILLIEEPEISLHPAAQADVFDFFIEMATQRKHQIIFTSHSEYLLRRFARYASDKGADSKLLGTFNVTKDKDGAHFERLRLEDLGDRLAKRQDLLPSLHERQ